MGVGWGCFESEPVDLEKPSADNLSRAPALWFAVWATARPAMFQSLSAGAELKDLILYLIPNLGQI